MVLTRDKDPVIINPGDASEIDTMIGEYPTHMLQISTRPRSSDGAVHAYQRIAEKICGKIRQPIKQHRTGKELVIVPLMGL